MRTKKILFKFFTLFLSIILIAPTIICADSVDMNKPCIVIHAGEYPGKEGKRSYIADKIDNLDEDIYPTERGNQLGEFYLNKPICQKVAKYIRKGDDRIKVVEFYSKDRSTDLNAAGRTAVSYNPDMYLAIHHNCTEKNEDVSRGFICMTAAGNYKKSSERVAQSIAKHMKSVSDRTGLPQFVGFKDGNWKDNTYVGEMNECNKFCPTVLIEVAFFNNVDDLNVSTNAKKNDLIAKSIALAVLKEFHSGRFDNDQAGETKQDTTMKGAEKITITETKKQVEAADDKDKNIKNNKSTIKRNVNSSTQSKLEWLKEKIHNSGKKSLAERPTSLRTTNVGKKKISSLKSK